jgi:uncharacterized protein (TIGR03435 family)
VLRTVGEARVYADGILNVCRFYVESPLRCVAGVTGADLKKRIEAIMRNRAAEKLNFAKKVALAVAGMAAVVAPVVVGIMDAPALHAQAVGAIPKWEVASIRPCESSGAGGGRGGEPPVASLRLNCATVAMLIRSAYDTSADGRQTKMIPTLTITGGPSWINTERYTINAKAEGTPAQAMMRGPMMQALLEDRFQLKIRRETREVPVYELVAAKGGPKLKASREGTCPTPNPAGGSCPGSVWVARKGSNLVVDQQETLDGFSRMLSQRVGRPVIDKTGLKGLFDFHLEFMPDEPAVFPGDQGPTAPAAAADPGGASIFTAAQEQLGLRLEPAKGPGEFLVIDSIEKPSEN